MEKNGIRITNAADVCHIDIEGTIGVPEEWQFDQPSSRVATYEKFRDTVQAIAGIDSPEVIVEIRSTGGDVNDALLIYDALKGLDAHIVTRCYGYTASAATIIAQAASEGCRMISPNALYLIHKSMCMAEGNADEIETRAELLRKTDVRIAELYAARSGRPAEEFSALMAENNGQGRWLSPEEAVAAGLADTVTGAAAESDGSEAKSGETPKEFFARNWKRLTAAFAGSRTAAPPAVEDVNVLHFGPVTARTQSDVALSIGFLDAQRKAAATATRPVEDPATAEMRRSANERAYAADARSFAHTI